MVDQVINEQSPIGYDPTLVVPVQQPGNNLQTFTLPVGDIASSSPSDPVANTIFVDQDGTLITNDAEYIAAYDYYFDKITARRAIGVPTETAAENLAHVESGFYKLEIEKRGDGRFNIPLQSPTLAAAKLLVADGSTKNPYPTIESGYGATTADEQVVRIRGGSFMVMTSSVTMAFNNIKLSAPDAIIVCPPDAPGFIGVDGISLSQIETRGLVGVDELSPIAQTEYTYLIISSQLISAFASTVSPFSSQNEASISINSQLADGGSGNFLFDVGSATQTVVRGIINEVNSIGVVDESATLNSNTVEGIFGGKTYGFINNNVIWVDARDPDNIGSDSNDGRTEASPVATIQHAVDLGVARYGTLGCLIRAIPFSIFELPDLTPIVIGPNQCIFDLYGSHVIGNSILRVPATNQLPTIFNATSIASSSIFAGNVTFQWLNTTSNLTMIINIDRVTLATREGLKEFISSGSSVNLNIKTLENIISNPGPLFNDIGTTLGGDEKRFTGTIESYIDSGPGYNSLEIYSGPNPSAVSMMVESRAYDGYYALNDASPVDWKMARNVHATLAMSDLPGDTRSFAFSNVDGMFNGQENTLKINQAASPDNVQEFVLAPEFIPYSGIPYVTSKESGALDIITFVYSQNDNVCYYRVETQKAFNPENTVYISGSGDDDWDGSQAFPLLTHEAGKDFINDNYSGNGSIVTDDESNFLIEATVDLAAIKVYAPMSRIIGAAGVLPFTCLANPSFDETSFVAKEIGTSDATDATFIQVQDFPFGPSNFKIKFDSANVLSDTNALVNVLDAANQVNVEFDSCGFMNSSSGNAKAFQSSNNNSIARGSISRMSNCDITDRSSLDAPNVFGKFGNVEWSGGVLSLFDGANITIPLDRPNLRLALTVLGNRIIDNPGVTNFVDGQTFTLEIKQNATPVELVTFSAGFKFQADQIYTPTTSAGATDKIVITANHAESRFDCVIIYDYPA